MKKWIYKSGIVVLGILSVCRAEASLKDRCVFPLETHPLAAYGDQSASQAGRNYFGADLHGRKNPGVGLVAELGSAVIAIEDGEVVRAPYHFYNGTFAAEIRHANGLIVRYGGLRAKEILEEGMQVKKGMVIGYLGEQASPQLENQAHRPAGKLVIEMYRGTESGPLTQAVGAFRRRSDLIDPTRLLKSWEKNLR